MSTLRAWRKLACAVFCLIFGMTQHAFAQDVLWMPILQSKEEGVDLRVSLSKGEVGFELLLRNFGTNVVHLAYYVNEPKGIDHLRTNGRIHIPVKGSTLIPLNGSSLEVKLGEVRLGDMDCGDFWSRSPQF